MIADRGNLRKISLLRFAHDSVLSTKHFGHKFSRPGPLVPGGFDGTFETSRACSMTLQHLCFVGCETDDDCFEESDRGLVKIYSRQF